MQQTEEAGHKESEKGISGAAEPNMFRKAVRESGEARKKLRSIIRTSK